METNGETQGAPESGELAEGEVELLDNLADGEVDPAEDLPGEDSDA